MTVFNRLTPFNSDLPGDVQNERQIAMFKVIIAIIGITVALLWFSSPIRDNGGWLILTPFVLGIWAILNGVLFVALQRRRHISRVAFISTAVDVAMVGLLDVAILQDVPFDFISGPLVALYFTVITAASLRRNARLVRLTGAICAILHLTIVLAGYFISDIPSVFVLTDSDSHTLKWQMTNDVLLCLAMASFGFILGQSTSELIESENHYLALFNSISDGIVIISGRMRILASNRRFQEMTGVSEDELLGEPLQQFFAGKSPAVSVRHSTREHRDSPFTRLYGRSGSIPVQITQSPIDWNGHRCFEMSFRDMSDRYRLELDLARAQKVQAVGKLAGGLAHDFNNILSGIFGAVSLSKRVIGRLNNPDETQPFTRYLDTISDCGQTATQILERLSTFSRSSIVETATIDILDVLSDTVTIMSNTLPPNIQIHISNTTSLTAKADKTSLTQALMNLCINARDAIGDMPGNIELSAEQVLSNALPAHLNLNPDTQYICIRVRDTGPGMDENTLGQIFDPFFTTKSKDQGSGIGLSMVYNIAFVHGGAVDVTSIPGKETVFFLYIEASRDSLLPLD